MKKLVVAFFLLCSTQAWAQYGELWFSAGQSLMTNAGLGMLTADGSNNDIELTDGFRFGFRFAINKDGHTGYEIMYAYSRTHLRYNYPDGPVEQGMGVHTGGLNYMVYATPLEMRIRPFVTGGVHFSNYVPPGASASYGQGSTKFGINYGAGIKIRATDIFTLRFDYRQYSNPKPSFFSGQPGGWLHQNEVSAGVGIYF